MVLTNGQMVLSNGSLSNGCVVAHQSQHVMRNNKQLCNDHNIVVLQC